MGAGADAGDQSLPVVPDPADSSNPFNNTVEESDLPDPAGVFETPAEDVSDPLFPPTTDVPETGNGVGDLFDIPADPPAEDSGFDSGGDLFDQSGLFPPPPEKPLRTLGSRSIKSRGVSLQARGKLKVGATTSSVLPLKSESSASDSPSRLSQKKKKAPAKAPNADGELDLVSYSAPLEDFALGASSDTESPVSKLSDSQIDDALDIPTLSPSTSEPESIESTRRNPLRRNSASVSTSDAPKQTLAKPAPAKLTAPALIEPDEAFRELVNQDAHRDEVQLEGTLRTSDLTSTSRSLSQVVASRSLRDTIRKNPLR